MEKTFSTVEDIIADEGFQAWYFKVNEAAVQAWERRMASDPAITPLVAEAAAYMAALVLREQAVPASEVAAAEQRLMNNLPDQSTAPVIGMKRRTSRWWWAAAAVLLIGISTAVLLNRHTPAMLHTAYGEIRKQQLPDGSTVMLNANSEISYHEGWTAGTSREIWLKGEAFFQVTKTPSKTRFIVHTDRFDVIVTGTQFNVMNRAGKTNVMLTEGSVTLKTRDGKVIYMKPGDFVELNDQQPELKTAREENVLAWKDKKLFFEKTPLRIAVQQIEELYGVKISLANDKVANEPISGIMMNDNLDVLLQALEAATGFHVVPKGNEILITE